MKVQTKSTTSRRAFLGAATAAPFAFSIVPSRVLGQDAPSNKLNIAAVGAGGRARADLMGVRNENVIAICDVDLVRGANMIKQNAQAKVYRDFRVMLDEMDKEIDAVIVAIPDHAHYVAAMAAIERGKHVYCEKPLAHSVYEVRKLTEAARKHKVLTQMGNQGHSSEEIRLCCEWVQSGRIGDVCEVNAWCDRPAGGYAFPASMPRPTETPPVPDTLNWDLWLGPAQERPYHPAYAPIFWRSWIDFGTGSLGDMGCHILDPAFWALKLGSPISVEANVSYNPAPSLWKTLFGGQVDHKKPIARQIEEMRRETYPSGSIIRYEFPARGNMPPVKLTWYDGGLLPPRPAALPANKSFGGCGTFIIGETGTIMHGSHGAGGVKLLPDSKLKSLDGPPKTIERVSGHHQDWIRACKTDKPASSNFDYGGPLTEMVLLGVIAMRIPNTRLMWDGEKMEFTNSVRANELVKPAYRDGWTL